MALPANVYFEGAAGGQLDPDRQQGSTVMDPAEFVGALLAENGDWSGEPPDVAEGEPIEFDVAGPDGQTATVTVEARENSADPVDGLITHFVIEYA
jgi:hypothetical protein